MPAHSSSSESTASGWDGSTGVYTTPSWASTGDNAWQLTSASLVGMQCIVGLSMMYGGLAPRKWALNSAFMAVYAYAATLLWWPILLYGIGFGSQAAPFFGIPKPVITLDPMLSQSVLPEAGIFSSFPTATMMYFQSVFGAITVIIIAGAVMGRMSFKAWMVFCPLWLFFSYGVGAYTLWAGGFLYQRGVLDFAGGLVVHCSSGTAGWIAAKIVGPRHFADRRTFKPVNLVVALGGTGILWIGWNGFNGGNVYAATPAAGVAVLNTNIATAASMLTWMLLDIVVFDKPSIIGAIQGIMTGLVAITPAGCFLDGWAAIVIGIVAGIVPWLSMNYLGKMTWFLAFSDDTLGVFHTHLVASFVGNFLTGVFARAEGVAAFGTLGAMGGAIEGNANQLGWQMAGFLFVFAWNLVVTPLILYFIKYVLRIQLRLGEAELLMGDDAVHGEAAYSLVDESQLELLYPRMADVETGPSSRSYQDDHHHSHLTPPRNAPKMAEWEESITPTKERRVSELDVTNAQVYEAERIPHDELPTLTR